MVIDATLTGIALAAGGGFALGEIFGRRLFSNLNALAHSLEARVGSLERGVTGAGGAAGQHAISVHAIAVEKHAAAVEKLAAAVDKHAIAVDKHAVAIDDHGAATVAAAVERHAAANHAESPAARA